MKYTKYLFLILAVAFLAVSCHKDPPKTYDDTDMTVTHNNPDFNFAVYNTFIIPDSAVLKTNYLEDNEVDYFYKEDGTSDKALQIVKESFLGLGYDLVDSLSQADFIALPTVLMMQAEEQVKHRAVILKQYAILVLK